MVFKLIAVLLFATTVKAQSVYVDTAQHPLDQHVATAQFLLSKNNDLAENKTAPPFVLNTNLASVLSSQLRRLESVAPQRCQDESSYDYVLSLTVQGAFESCYQYVAACLRTHPQQLPLTTIMQGARCARSSQSMAVVQQVFEAGLRSPLFRGDNASALVLEYGLFAQYSIYQSHTSRILAAHPFWSAGERGLAQSLIDFLGKTADSEAEKTRVFNFIDQQIAKSQGFYSRLLRTHRVQLNLNEYRFQNAFQLLQQDAAFLQNPLDWWPAGFQTLYRLAENADFSLARNLYSAFIPYSNPRSYFPLEQNLYTYTQIENNICQDTMMSTSERQSVQKDLDNWKQSKLSLAEMIRRLEERDAQNSEKSDLLSAYAGLLVIANRPSEAREYYWRAHQLCPYNNRSHWGLLLLERKQRYASYPEFSSNLKKMEETLSGISFPNEIQSYIVNWNAFPEASQKRIKYGARIWAPFMKELNSQNYKVYIKMPFELLSMAPSFSSIRDRRIGPPDMPTYKLDNRLWDDVRGAGGRYVVADHDETFETVQGDYNLLGHEIAHQFHAYLDSRYKSLSSCIEKLYSAAKTRNSFPDPYAATNSREYFAQGMTYFLVPADAPARYGINVSWYPQNDPDLYRFMLSIEDAKGDFRKIRCPL